MPRILGIKPGVYLQVPYVDGLPQQTSVALPSHSFYQQPLARPTPRILEGHPADSSDPKGPSTKCMKYVLQIVITVPNTQINR